MPTDLIVHELGTDLQKFPEQIVLDLLETNYPDTDENLPDKTQVTFAVDNYLDNTDFQISVLNDPLKGRKTKVSFSLFEYIYQPMIHIWVRKNTETRPTEIDYIKNLIDKIIVTNQAGGFDGVSHIECDLPEEVIETQMFTNEEEDITVKDTYHVKILVRLQVFKWIVTT